MKSEDISPERAASIRCAVKLKYRAVAAQPEGHFAYPIGKESALKLGYDPSWLKGVPGELISRFVGVGNPFQIRMPKVGDRVLDAGCGCGLDAFIAAFLAGSEGRVFGIDLTRDMLALPLAVLSASKRRNIEFMEASVEFLPFRSGAFDMVISNGALNLVPDKAAAFSEIARILRPGGALSAADLLVVGKIPPEVLADTDAWST